MAKKKPSFRELYGSWSAQEASRERDSQDPRNRQARGEEILNTLIAQGEDISDEQYGVMLSDYMNTGEMSLPGASAEPVLPAAADERPMPQMSAISAETAFDNLATDPLQMVRDLGARFRASSRTGLAGLLTGPGDVANAAISSPANVALAESLGIVLPQVRNPKGLIQEAARLREEAAAIRRTELSDRSRVGEDVLAEAEGLSVIGTLARNPTLLADQAAEQAGQFYSSLPGAIAGPAGMVVAQGTGAAGQQGEEAYQAVLAKGGSETEAQAARNIAAGVSFVANTAVPTLTPKGTALEELITGAAEKAAGRSVVRAAVAPLVGEAVSEAFTEALDQGGLNIATGEPWSRGLTKAAALGAALGTGMGAGPAAVDANAVLEDRANRRAELESLILADQPRTDAITPVEDGPSVDRQLFDAEQDIQADAAKASSLEAAFTAREQEAATQKELEEEAGFRTIERDTDLPTSRVERYADVVERVPVNPPAEVTAEQVAAEREQAAELAAQSKRVAEINKVAARRKTLESNAAKKAGDAEKKAQAAEASLRTRATDALIAEGLDDAAVTDALPARMSKMREEALAKKAAPVAKKTATKKTAAKKPAAPKVAPDVAKLKASSNPLDRAQAEVLERLGMEGKGKTTVPDDFGDKVKKIVRAVTGDASRRGAAVEKLIKQGKVRIVPNAPSGTTRAGEYDTATGTTFIYTDNLSDNVHADIMEATAHETTHLGQFNDRDQRPEMLKALLGNKTTSDGAKALRTAAKSGNKFAQAALDAAEADTAARKEAGEDNPSRYEDAELVAYAVGAENAARTGSIGQAGGALRDAVAGAKAQVRKRLGLDLDVSLGDLRSAMGRVLEEGAATGTSAADSDERLGMIYNRNSKGFDEAVANGWVYDSVDGDKKFVLSDADSKIKPGAARELADSEMPMALGDILDHEVLYREHPEAADIDVVAVDSLGKNVFGMYDSADRTIYIARELAANTDPYRTSLREGLMHEVQHFVQNEGGYTHRFYSGKDRDPTVVKARAELKKAERANDQAAATLLTNATRLTPNRDDKLAVATIVRGEGSDHRKATQLVELFGDMEVPAELQDFINDFDATKKAYNEKATAANLAGEQAYANYQANITEREAFRTQYDVDAPESEIRARGNPEPMMRKQEEMDGVDQTGGRIDVPVVGGGVEARGEVLGMAGKAQSGKTAFRNRNRLTTALTAAVRNDKGLGTHIRDEVELAKAAPVEFEAKANRAAGKYDSAIKAMAKSKGITPDALNAQIRTELEGIADMEGSASEYAAAFNAIADKYGKAGAALKELRGLVDDLSTEFIRTYLDSGVKLTNKEKDDVRKVAANLGRYVHRFYASRLGRGLGKQYADSVQAAVDQANEKGKSSLTPKQKELFDRYAGAAKTILDGVMIPDEAGMADLQDSHVDYLYDTWIGTDPTGVTREEKEAALQDVREDIGPEDLQNKVDAAAQALLYGVEEAAATRFYDRGEKINTTIMQKRSHIPKEIRALMGEVTDPAGALVNTVSKQAEYVARTKMMLALRDMASPQDLQPPGSAGNAAVRANNMTELKGEGFGPLQGYFASPAMKAMIDDTAESLMNFTEAMTTGSRNNEAGVEAAARTAARVWMKGAGAAKAINILGNVFRFPLNFAGSFAMLGANGNFNVKSYARGLQDATSIIRYASKPSHGLGSAELVSKYRVVDSATVGDLKNLDMGKIEQVVREMSGKSPGAFLRKGRELKMAGRELYAMMDVWSKIANFHAEVSFLKSMYKADGVSKTDDEIYREASAIVNNTNMSYARTMPMVKAIERGGITQYGPYLYEAHRVALTNVYQALSEIYRAKDMNTPAAAALMAGRGLARLTGVGSTLAMIGALSHFFAGTFGDDEEEKRALLPEYARVMDFMQVGTDEDGKPILYAVSNIDPLGPLTDMYRAARIGDRPLEAVWDQFKENYIAPALGGAVWDAVARTTGIVEPTSARPRKPLVQQWWPQGWSAVTGATGGEDKWASVAHLIETRFMPGTARAWSDSNPIAAGGTPDEMAYNIARGIGARGIRYDPSVGVADAAFNYDDTLKAVRRDIAAYLETTTNPSAEELTSRLLTLRQDEKKAWDQLHTVRKGLEALGKDEDEIRAYFKTARVPKEVITQIMNDEFSSRAISKTSLQSAETAETKRAKTEAAKDKVSAKWEVAREVVGAVQGDE